MSLESRTEGETICPQHCLHLDSYPCYLPPFSNCYTLPCRHYVPAVSYAIQKYNKKHDDSPINLKGLAIGNGLTDPAIQYGAYADFAEKNGLISPTVRDTILQVRLTYEPSLALFYLSTRAAASCNLDVASLH